MPESSSSTSAPANQGNSFLRKFLGRSMLAFAIKLASAGLSFGMFVLLARAMGQSDYGLFAAAFSLATLMAVLGTLGQKPIVVRFGSAYHEQGQHALRRGVMRRGYLIAGAGCLATLAIVAPYYWVLDGAIPWALVGGIVAVTFALGVSEYQSFALRVTAGVGLSLAPRDVFWRTLICLVAGASALGWGLGALSATAWMWLMAVTLIAILGLQFWINERRGPEAAVRGQTAYATKEWNAPMLNLWLSSVVMTAATTVSVILIERMISAEEAGPFFSAMRTAQLLNLFLFATSVISSPMLSRSLSRGAWGEVQRVAKLTALVGGGFGMIGFLVLVFGGDLLLGLFGPGFDQGYAALIILGAGFLVNTLAGPTGPLLEMSGHEKAYVRFLTWANVVGLIAMIPAIWFFGTLGAAAATAGISASWNIAAWAYCRRVLRVDPSVIALVAAPRPPGPPETAVTKDPNTA